MVKSKATKKIPPTMKKTSVVSSVATSVSSFLGGKGKGKGRKKKKSAYWYAKEIQRLKLKRRYDKVKLGVLK